LSDNWQESFEVTLLLMILDHDVAGWAILALAWILSLAWYAGITLVVARLSGAGVEEVAVGFGPFPLSWQHTGTRFCLRPIPLGAYVKLLGESDDRPVPGSRYSELLLATRLGLHLIGHLATLALGIAILAIGPSERVARQIGLLVAGNALLNLLPLPAYAGGRVIFEVWSAVWQAGPPEESRSSGLYLAGVLLSLPVGMALLAALWYVVLARYDNLIAWLAAIGLRL
jgi:membrane-associated protease RseP (regulator of RpoE activity)